MFDVACSGTPSGYVARCCGVLRIPWERLPSNLDRPALFTSGATPERAMLEGVIPFQARAHLPGSDSRARLFCVQREWFPSHEGVPKTAHLELLTPKEPSLGPVLLCSGLLCRFCSPFSSCGALCWCGVVGACALVCSVSSLWFFSSSVAPFRRGALLCCLRPLVVPARLDFFRWVVFFLREGDDTSTDHVLQVPLSQVTTMTLGGRMLIIGLEWDIQKTIGFLYMKSSVFAIRASIPLVVMW